MKITIQIRVESDEGQLEVVQQLAHLDRGILRPETLGLSLAEAQSILAGIEQTVVEQQTAEFIALQRTCSQCVMPPFTLPQIGMAFAALAYAQYPNGLVNCGTNFSINRVAVT